MIDMVMTPLNMFITQVILCLALIIAAYRADYHIESLEEALRRVEDGKRSEYLGRLREIDKRYGSAVYIGRVSDWHVQYSQQLPEEKGG